jgi:hypothetical protein
VRLLGQSVRAQPVAALRAEVAIGTAARDIVATEQPVYARITE